LIAAQYVGVTVNYPQTFNMGHDNKTPEFLAKFPEGKVPAADTPDGPIWESTAIARYVAGLGKNNNLLGSNNYEASLIQQWVEWVNNELSLPSDAWLYPIFGYAPNNAQATAKAKEDVKKQLHVLNDYLLTRTFLVGQRVSFADIVVSMQLYRMYTSVFDPNYRRSFPNVTRWFQTCVHQPQFKSVVGEVKLCEKMQEAAATASAAGHHDDAGKQNKEGKKNKEEKKKGGEKPEKKDKQQKQEAHHEAEGEGGHAAAEGEEEEEAAPKLKSALDLLPPAKMALDEWKRVYSNNDTKTVAIPWFWEHFDRDGYSVFFATYKHNAELKKLFMTLNTVGGFLQRLEKLHKYAFGSVLIFGDEDKGLTISSLWIFRGSDIPAEMKECDDYDLYEWSRANLDDPKTKKLIEEYLAWEGDFDGRGKPHTGKTFK